MSKRYYRAPIISLTGLICVVLTVTISAAAVKWICVTSDETENKSNCYTIDVVHEQRVKFAASHGVTDPIALAAAVRNSPMANLLISVAIEESRGDPVAVGLSGEQGAWQVKPLSWGSVPENIHGQARQAERIIRGLLIDAKGDKKEALARYNGGTTPPEKSYRYAERILKRTKNLQVAVNYLPLYFCKTSYETLLYPL